MLAMRCWVTPTRMATALAIALFVALFGCTPSPNSTSTPVTAQHVPTLLPAPADFGENALWGFVDENGKWVLQPRFQGASRFSEGLAAVEIGGRWGYVDGSGTLVIPPQFTEAHYFTDGLAPVATGAAPDPEDHYFITASGYGFIDKTGTMVIPATYDDAGDFSEGLAAVMQGTSVGFIDATGDLVIPLKFDAAVSFSEGLAAVASDGEWGYIDKSGAWAIQPQFPGATLNAVPEDASYLAAKSFHNGLAPVLVQTDSASGASLWQYIDKTGKKAFDRTFSHAGEFSEGLAPVLAAESEGWGFIDTSGTVIITGPLSASRFLGIDTFLRSYGGFHQGLALAAQGGKLGYIDQAGKFVVAPQFAEGDGFRDGFAYVTNWPSTDPDPLAPLSPSALHRVRPLEIIDLTGRVIYQAPAPSGTGSIAATTNTAATAVTIPDGIQFGFVRQATAGTLTFDPAEFLGGDEALEAARADGAIGPADDLSDPFYIRNPDRQEVLLEVDPAAQFTLFVAPENSDLVQKTVSMDELVRLFGGGAQDPHASYYIDFALGLPIDLTISAGRVTGGMEQYVP